MSHWWRRSAGSVPAFRSDASRTGGVLPIVGLAASVCCLLACSPPRSPITVGNDFAARFQQAESLGQSAPAPSALEAYLQILLDASHSPDSDDAFDAAAASLDAMVSRTDAPLADLGAPHALAFRIPGGPAQVRGYFEVIWQSASAGTAFLRPLVASSALAIAMSEGNAHAARTWRQRTGCVRRATLFGPLAAYGLALLPRAFAFEKPGAPLPSELASSDSPVAVAGLDTIDASGCSLPLTTTSSRAGLRAVVVDLQVVQPQRVWVALTAKSPAVVTLGGSTIATRGVDAGGGEVTSIGAAHARAGRLRLTVRVALRDEGDAVVLQVVGEDGLPLPTVAPNAGDTAPSPADAAPARPGRSTADAATRLLRASAELALGNARRAGVLLEQDASKQDASPAQLLAYARALGADSVLPDNRRVERMRDAYERAAARAPSWWEPAVGRAWLEGQRSGQAESRVQAILALHTSTPPVHPMVSVFEALMAGRARVRETASAAWEASRRDLGDAPVMASLEGVIQDQAPRERARFRCANRGFDGASLDCYAALVELGDTDRSAAELRRLRDLMQSPGAFGALATSAAVRRGDEVAALQLYQELPPGQRFYSPLGLVLSSRPKDVLALLHRDLAFAPHDAPSALDLWIAASASALRAWDEKGASAVAEDRAHPAMPDAALLVVDHHERYELDARGVAWYVVHDVRRVSGTTDVEGGDQSVGPMVDGMDVRRVLRRRVHKRDGRVLEPEDAAQAEQSNADLSQLQPGDYVEQLVAGVAVPGGSGRFVIDTPDLMPERTAVRRASVTIERASGLAIESWAHPLFSRTAETHERETGVTSRWELADKPARRLESGIPRMDRRVRVTFGNLTWAHVAASLADNVIAMTADDSVLAAFARETAGKDATPSLRLLQRLVKAVGTRLPVASGAALSDTGAAMSSGPQRATARTIFESAHGSRTWLVRELLRTLSVSSEVVVAEEEPFSSTARFPAHQGRFSHPLLLVHLPAGPDGGDVWLDLDVPGPPLPPGRVSEELQGRSALRTSGQMIAVPAMGGAGPGDEIDVKLAVDEQGHARGELTLQLRGRAAQTLAESFETTVGAGRQELLRGVVLAWIPRADVLSVELVSEEGSWEVVVRAAIVVPGFAQPEGKRWLLPGLLPLHHIGAESDATTLTAEFAPEGDRQSALALAETVRYQVHRRIELPAGWRFAGAPTDVTVDGAPLRATRAIRTDGRTIDETYGLSVSAGTVSAEAFEPFIETARRIDDTFMHSIAVERGSSRGGEEKR